MTLAAASRRLRRATAAFLGHTARESGIAGTMSWVLDRPILVVLIGFAVGVLLCLEPTGG